MPSINSIKYTIGGPESPAGDAANREYVIPIRGAPGLDKTAEKAEDPAIVGDNMAAAEYLMSDNVTGPMPLSIRPCGAIGSILKSCLGTEETPVQVAAGIRLRYTGSEVSCKIIADATNDELESYLGAKGSESGDTNFGTAGVIDLTSVDYDTVGELVTYIDSLSEYDYDCEKVFGADSVDSGEMLAFTSPANNRQGKNRWVYIFFASADSGVYLHQFTPNLGTTERSNYSIQKDGYQDNFLFDGCVADTFSMSAALKGMVEGECGILGMVETGSQEVSALTLEEVEPLRFHDGSFSLNGKTYTYIRNHSIAIANNHMPEGYGQGSTSRLYHQKGIFGVSGDMQLRLDSDSFAERAKVFNNAQVGLSFYYKAAAYSGSIYQLMIVEIPYVNLSTFEYPENSGVFDAKLAYKAFKPHGTNYNDPLTVSMLTVDSGVY